ncbi:MAG: DJ-1/PfpI family protein [Bacteroidales bacterium]|nr:DJ-1/PfpI family protein [Bacteroidales bacterium]
MKGVHIFLADGFEDMEALGTRDVLLRGGVPVITVSVTDDYLVESSHGLQVTADTSWADLEVMEPGTGPEDVMVFPGGMPGSKNLAQHAELMEILQDHWARGGTVAAICAAPGLVVSQLPGLQGRRFTCFDGFQEALIGQGAEFTPEPAVTDGNLITGRGAGHAVAFGLAILEALKGAGAAAKVRAGLML